MAIMTFERQGNPLRPVHAQERDRFTLIEVMMAIAIAAIGVVSIMGFMYTAWKTSRDTRVDIRVGLAAEHFSSVLSQTVRGDWGAFVNTTSGTLGLPVYDGGVYNKDDLTDFANDPGWMELSETPFYQHNSRPGLYKMSEGDFSASIRVWQQQAESQTLTSIDTPVDISLSDSSAVRVVTEFTWPFADPYPERKRWYFPLFVINPSD